jgi:hypothetical protein
MNTLGSVLTAKKLKSLSRQQVVSLLFLFIICLPFQYSNAQFSCAGLSTTNISYTGAPQNFVVPAGVSQVRISLTGASGGQASSSANLAGGGATVYAYVSVVPGDVFRVIVGQKGVNGITEAGGGGSSAVYKNGVLIMVAGAGGGEDNTGDGGNGAAAEDGVSGGNDSGTSASGGCSTSPDNGRAGTGGQGGYHGEWAANCPHGGGGGGGLLSAGLGNGNINAGQSGGQGNINGIAGGAGSSDDAVGINGGWGWSGGGGADDKESGGGGGYSGGGGGPESRHPGGGGSFVAAIGTNGITSIGKTDGTGTTTGFNGSAQVCSSPAITLPVNFGGISAEQLTTGALIKWISVSELNTAYYEIEKSTDGVLFTAIGKVLATGNSAEKRNYQFTDPATISGKTYYRIKAVDLDDVLSYSGVTQVNGSRELSLTIFPNPAFQKINIRLPYDWQQDTHQVQLLNPAGQVVLEKNMSGVQQELNVQALPVGLYIIQVTNKRTNNRLSARITIGAGK